MTISELKTILEGIEGFSGKVAYRSFKGKKVPQLPYICFMATQTNNFKADNQVYKIIQSVDIELYSRMKDETSEGLIESALNSNNIVWEKYEEYIDNEEVYQITYEIEV